MFMMGAWEVVVLLLVSAGGVGLPLGIPPGEEDPLLAKVAPEDCTFYLSWAGMAEPDPDSKNEAELLLAEQEVQRFVQHLDRAITAAIMERGNDGIQKVIAENAPTIVKSMLTNPGAVFVGKISLGIRGIDVDGGIVVNTGDDTEKLKQAVSKLEQALGPMVRDVDVAGQTWKEFPMPQDAPRMVWGFQGKYMILGVGEGSVDRILQRVRSEPPKWLSDLREKLTIPRRSTVMYLNVRAVLAFALANTRGIEARAVASALGLDNVDSLASATGLDETGFVNRTLVSLDGKPRGLFAIVSGEPLSAADLAPIPKDATFALAARVDLNRIYSEIREGVNRVDPDAPEAMEDVLQELQRETGLKLKEDVLLPLGDCWRVYNSPSDGGLLFTGLTAVVSVRDRDRVVQVLKKIQDKSIESIPEEDPDRSWRRRYVVVRDFEYAGQKVYFLNSVGEFMPFAPAWCVTDKEFVISLFPSHVKSYLARGADFESIASVPQVAERIGCQPGPVALGYQNTRELFKLWYPVMQFVAQFMCSEAQRNGVDIDVSMLPSASAITPHLLPATVTVTHQDGEIEVLGHQSVPLSTGPLPLAVPMFFMGTMTFARASSIEEERMIQVEAVATEAAAEAVRTEPLDESAAPRPELRPVPVEEDEPVPDVELVVPE